MKPTRQLLAIALIGATAATQAGTLAHADQRGRGDIVFSDTFEDLSVGRGHDWGWQTAAYARCVTNPNDAKLDHLTTDALDTANGYLTITATRSAGRVLGHRPDHHRRLLRLRRQPRRGPHRRHHPRPRPAARHRLRRLARPVDLARRRQRAGHLRMAQRPHRQPGVRQPHRPQQRPLHRPRDRPRPVGLRRRGARRRQRHLAGRHRPGQPHRRVRGPRGRRPRLRLVPGPEPVHQQRQLPCRARHRRTRHPRHRLAVDHPAEVAGRPGGGGNRPLGAEPLRSAGPAPGGRSLAPSSRKSARGRQSMRRRGYESSRWPGP